MPRAGRELARELGEHGGLDGCEGRVVVGRREMRHHPRQSQRAASAGQLATHGQRIARRHSPAAHPVSALTWTSQATPAALSLA